MCLDSKGASRAKFAARPEKPWPHLAPRRLLVARRHLDRGAASRRAGEAGQTITNQTVATVTNPAGNATTSIVINGSTVTGAVANAGTISPGTLVGTGTVALSVTNSTIGGGITNTGTITANGANSNFATSINITGSTVSSGITNAGTINASDMNVNCVTRDVLNFTADASCSRRRKASGSSRAAARSVRAQLSARARRQSRASPSATPISGRAARSVRQRHGSSGAGVGYDINRAAPLIAGVDWRLDNGIVAGVAATYVASSAKFKDGSSTNVNSYQGARLRGMGRRAVVHAWEAPS